MEYTHQPWSSPREEGLCYESAVVGGVVRPPAARRVRAVVPHTGACRPQAACNMRVRVPASVRARVRAVRPRARASARHTHISPTILSVLPAGSRRSVCARGRPPISCSLSLTHSLTVACFASDMPVTWALGRRADGRADACAPVDATPMKKPATASWAAKPHTSLRLVTDSKISR